MGGITRAIILSAVAGDALGTPLDGMSRGHIGSCFGPLPGYVDPWPALRGRMERWKKPGLYSSISQLMLLLGISCVRRGQCVGAFARLIADSCARSESGSSLFRYTDAAESGLLNRCRETRQIDGAPASGAPSTRVLAALAPLAFRPTTPKELLAETMAFIRLFTADRQTLAAGLAYAFLLRALSTGQEDAAGPAATAPGCAEDLVRLVSSECPSMVFEAGVNPDALAEDLRGLAGIFSLSASAGMPAEAEERICGEINRSITGRIARATVNLPFALFPYAVSLSSFLRGDPGILYRAAAEGGSAAPLAAIVGTLAAAGRDRQEPPAELVRDLVNRKRIESIAACLEAGSADNTLAGEFVMSEASLTAKAEEELRARTRHGKKPEKKTPSRGDRERALARHVVESWTKLDRARWKKERKQRERKEEP